MPINTKIKTGITLFTFLLALSCTVNPVNTTTPPISTPVIKTLTVTTSSFTAGQAIPETYCFTQNGHTGDNISPQLSWSGAPSNAVSYALVMDDNYSYNAYWSHWILYDLPVSVSNLVVAYNTNVTDGLEGKIDSGAYGYEGPYPPSGVHTYHFRLYALDTTLGLSPVAATRSGIMSAMSGHILAEGELTGTHAGH